MEILAIINFYFSVALFVLVLNAVIGGYQGKQINIDDVIQSAFWPVSLAQLLGTLIRIGVESYKEEMAKPKPKKKETK
jgi:hypothetical protein